MKIWPERFWIPIVNFCANWNYLEGQTEIPINWNTIDFDDSDWSSGPSGIGYGIDDNTTIIGTVISLYLRKIFQIENDF